MGNSDFIPASNVSEKFTGDECLSDSLTENRFYRQIVEDLKKCNVDLVSEDPLETIYNCICHLNNLFRVLRRPWSIECGKIQKAYKFYEGLITVYPEDELYKEVSFVAYYFHWSFESVMQMDHKTRRRFCAEISEIHKKISGKPKNIFEL